MCTRTASRHVRHVDAHALCQEGRSELKTDSRSSVHGGSQVCSPVFSEHRHPMPELEQEDQAMLCDAMRLDDECECWASRAMRTSLQNLKITTAQEKNNNIRKTAGC